MVKKTIKFTDYNGTERTEDYYFNLTKTELIKMQIEDDSPLADQLKAIVRAKDTFKLISLFEKIVLKAYGEKAPDGVHFMKKDEHGRSLAEKFIETPAYDELYVEMLTSPERFADFINAMIPADVAAEAEQIRKSGEIPEELKDLM